MRVERPGCPAIELSVAEARHAELLKFAARAHDAPIRIVECDGRVAVFAGGRLMHAAYSMRGNGCQMLVELLRPTQDTPDSGVRTAQGQNGR